ncbi:MAG: ATP-binding protein [bacterium]|nr:ATP-binding protein [bacterium]
MRSLALRFSLIVFCSLLVAMALVDAVVSALWFIQVRADAEAVARIWALQPLIAVYIVVNALIFSLLFFFRFSAHVSRPLQSLAAVAGRHQDDNQPTFPDLPQLGELHRLSFSLNRMLRRIEQDRARLQATAAELARKNEELLFNQEEMIRTEKLAATGRLAAGLAHELGNPLGVVQGYLELMQMEDCGDSERLEYSSNALAETDRMHRLISTLLQTARSRPGAVEPIDMHRVLRNFVTALQPQALLKGIAVRLSLGAENASVAAAEDSMRQVLLNALFNAVDAVRATGRLDGLIELTTQAVQKNGRAWFEICILDNGCGLDSEQAAKIFDPFFSTKEPGAGTGLGLSVSLSLVESMGGSMYALNREGGGMALYILLPLLPAAFDTSGKAGAGA